MGYSLRIVVLLFGVFTGSMFSILLMPLLGIQCDLFWSCAIQMYKFTDVYLPRGSTGKPSLSTSLTEEEQQMNKCDKLTLQLQMITNERNKLREFLANYTNNNLNNR